MKFFASHKTLLAVVGAALGGIVLTAGVFSAISATAAPGGNEGSPVVVTPSANPTVPVPVPAPPPQTVGTSEQPGTTDSPALPTGAPAVAGVTSDQAVDVALAHAGLTRDQVVFVDVRQDRENREDVWDIEFYAGQTEYDYEVRISDGAIVAYDQDIESHRIPGTDAGTSTGTGQANPPSLAISEEQAKQIALAQVSGASSIRIHLDRDDGRFVYEGEVIAGQMEYDFEIDATTGDIVEWEAEHLDHH